MTVVNKVSAPVKLHGFSTKRRYVVRGLGITILHEFLAALHPIYGVRRLRYGRKKIQSRQSPRF
jgi:hypothetical protein